jgi:hypothetical protein
MNPHPTPLFTLDLEEWVLTTLQDLHEPARLLGLEEILGGGFLEKARPLLENMVKADPAASCRSLARQILDVEAFRRNLAKTLPGTNGAPQKLLPLLESTDSVGRQAVLNAFRKPPAPDILNSWRSLVQGHSSPIGTVFGLGLLAKFGEAPDADLALAHLTSPKPEILNAALDLLVRHRPEAMTEQGPAILQLGFLSVTLHLVQYFRESDTDLALTHLNPLLRSADPGIRQKALRELISFPFEAAVRELLRFLSAEKFPILLVTAGASLALNPHPQLPLPIYDILLVSQGLKKDIVQLILKQAVENVQQAGILQQSNDEYLAGLKNQLQERKKRYTTQLLLGDLANSDSMVRLEALPKLRDSTDPKVLEQIRLKMKIETNQQVFDLMREILGYIPSSTIIKAISPDLLTNMDLTSELTPEKFAAAGAEKQKMLMVAIIGKTSFAKHRPQIIGLLQSNIPDEALLIVVTDLGNEMGTEETDALLPLLNHKHPSLQVQVLQLLARLNPESIFPFFPQFLNHDNETLKNTALELYLKFDKESALQILHSMTRSSLPTVRRRLLGLIPLLDEVSAEPLLLALFQKEENPEIKIQTGNLLAESPSLESLHLLFESYSRGGTRSGLGPIWEKAVQNSVPRLAANRAALEKMLQDRTAKEKQRQTTTAAPKQKKTEPPRPASSQEILKSLATPENLRQLQVPGIIALVAFLGFLVQYLFFGSSAPTGSTPARPPSGGARGGPAKTPRAFVPLPIDPTTGRPRLRDAPSAQVQRDIANAYLRHIRQRK